MTRYMEQAAKKLFSRYRFNSVLFKNFIKIFTLTAILLSVLCIFIYNSLIKINKDEMLSYNQSNAARIAENINNTLNEVRRVTATLAADPDVRSYVIAEDYETTMPELSTRLKEKLSSYRSIMNNIHSLYIYNQKTDKVFGAGAEQPASEVQDNEWIEAYMKNKDKGFFAIPRKLNNSYPYVISYICNVQSGGCLVVNADIYLISKTTDEDIKDGTEVYIINEYNRVVYSNKEKYFLTEFDADILKDIEEEDGGIIKINEDSFAGYIKNDDRNSWKFVVLTSIENYNEKIQRVRIMIILIISVIILLGIIVSLILAFNVYEPVSDIVKVIDSSDGREMISTFNDNEVKYVATKIMQIIDDNNDLKDELGKRMKEYQDLQFIALQSQINPHFLNNTLNVIVLKLAREVSIESESLNMLTAMTRLIRYVFRSGEIFVGFKTELEFLRMYVELLKKRYKDFDVEWDIDENVCKYKILNVCIQPIVENAVFHGVGAMREDGLVKIQIKEEESFIRINITDNGSGITPEKLEEIRAEFKKEAFDNIHVGIKNVYRRLKIVYSNEASMEIESEPGQFTSITMYIPKIEDENAD